jgi:hypothetical protein
MNMNTYYRTKDFYVSAYLLAMGHALRSCERNGKITTFFFDESPELQANVNNFYSSDSLVSPMRYSQSIRTMKAMLHANENEQNYVKQLQPQN